MINKVIGLMCAFICDKIQIGIDFLPYAHCLNPILGKIWTNPANGLLFFF